MTQYNTIQIQSDGGARGNPGPAGAGWVLKSDNNIIKEGKEFLGTKTNNQAEYTGLINALKDLKNFDYSKVEIFLDSELIVKQIKGEYRVKNPELKVLFQEAISLLNDKNWSISHVRREYNKEADRLVNVAIDAYQ